MLLLVSELAEEAGHEAVRLKRGLRSIGEIAATQPDVLFVHMRFNAHFLPNGWKLISAIRAHRTLADVPIIVCSADVGLLRSVPAGLGNVHPLRKPFSVEEAESLITSVVPTGRGEPRLTQPVSGSARDEGERRRGQTGVM